jgi:hypothetical protein
MNFKKIIVVLILIFVCVINVKAEQITNFTDYGTSSHNTKCADSINYCATDIFNSGIRITMIDYSGNQVAGTEIVNFWPTATIAKYADDDIVNSSSYELPQNSSDNSTVYSCTFNFQIRSSNKFKDVYNRNVSLPLNQTIRLYKKYLEGIDTNKVKTIINELTSNSTKDFSKYYLKLEPIYIIREKYLGDDKYNTFVKKLDELSKKNIKYSYIEYIKNNDPNNQNNSPFDNNIEVSETDLILYDILLKFCKIDKISYVKILPSNSLENKFFIIISYNESKTKYITNIK